MLKVKSYKTNYVATFWSGDRLKNDKRLNEDPLFYFKGQIKALEKYKHNLSQITFVIPYNPEEPKEFTSFVEKIPEFIHRTRVVIFRRKNYGMSYGAFSDIFEKYRTQFDYYFFTEDDYIFAQDYFDKIYIDFLRSQNNCAYACAKAQPTKNRPHYAYHSVGCIDAKATEELYRKNNKTLFPYPFDAKMDNPPVRLQCGLYGQVGFSRGLIDLGYKVLDMTHKYSSGFRHIKMNIYWHGKGPKMIVPI